MTTKQTKKQFIGISYDELLSENAKLREELEFERSENGWAREFLNRMGRKCGTKDCPSLVAYVTKIESDNAKLRELVRELWPFVKAGWIHACPSRECCLFEECDADSEYECLIEEHMAGRMRELGVVVE